LGCGQHRRNDMDDKSQAQQTLEVEELKRQLAAAKQGQENTEYQMERLLQAMLCASSETVVVMDREGIVLDANPAAVQRMGGSLEVIRGVCVYDLFDSQTGRRRKAMHEEVCCSRQCLFYEDQRDGRTIENHLCPVIDGAGEVSKVVVFAKDITENRRKENALRFHHTILDICQEIDQIRELLDRSIREIQHFTGCQAVGIRLLDKDGNIPYQAFEGFSHEFYVKESPLSIKYDQCMCIDVIQGKTDPSKPFFTPFGSFYMNRTSDFLATVSDEEKGKTRNACNEYGFETVALVPIRNKETILGLIHLADSQTEKMPLYLLETVETVALQLATTIQHLQSQAVIQEEKKRYRMLVENQNDLVVSFDSQLRRLYVSPSYCKVFGKTELELLGKSFMPLIDEEDIPVVQRSFERLRQPPYTTQHEEMALTANGWRWFSWVAKAVLNEEGVIESFVSVGRDVTDRKNVENALQESETKFRMAFSSSPVGMALLKPAGYFLMVNDVLCQMLGYSSDEMLRLTFRDITLPEDIETSNRHIRALLEGQSQHFSIEKRYVHKKGAVIWAMVNVGLVHDADGKPSYFVAQLQDITARKQAEEQLRFQSMILNQIRDHITATDMEGVITYVNQQEVQLLGQDSKNLIGKSVSIYGENSQEGATQQEIIDNTKKFGQWRGEVVNYTSDGKSIVMDCRTQVLYDVKGQAHGMVGIASDITERKQMENRLRESEERYRALVEFSPSAVVIMQDQKYVWVNPKTIELLGLKEIGDMVGVEALRFVCPEFHEIARSRIELAEKGEVKGPIEVQMLHSNGCKIWIEARLVPIRFQGQSAILITANDVTPRKTYELQMVEYQDKLKALVAELTTTEEAERKRIAAELHDRVGQLLVFAKMEHDMLVRTMIDAKQKTAAEEISRQLSTAITETQAVTYDLGSITLYERGFCKAIQEWIQEDYLCRHSLQVHFQHNVQCRISNPISLFLYRTVRELLVNVAKHAQARQVDITLIEKDNHLQLTVEDDGIGYETSIRKKKSKSQKSFGLLSIRERLDYMDGTINIDSHRDQGTTITITIPIWESDRAEDNHQ